MTNLTFITEDSEWQQTLYENSVAASAIYEPHKYKSLMKSLNYHEWPMENPETNGFQGRFYRHYDDMGRIDKWIFVVRGTIITNFRNIVNDIDILCNDVPSSVIQAQKYFMQGALSIRSQGNPYVAKSFDTVPLYIVGHSLGAIVAACIYADCSVSPHKNEVFLAAFETPGAADIVRKHLISHWKMNDFVAVQHMRKLEENASNFLGAPSIINTFHQHMGDIFNIIHYDFDDSIVFPRTEIPTNYLQNFYYLVSHTAQQHSIEDMIKIIKDFKDNPYREGGAPIYSTFRYPYPVGLRQGYHAYLYIADYVYWNDYFVWCWNNQSMDKSKYNNDINKFIPDKLIEVERAYNKTKENNLMFFKPKTEVIYDISNNNMLSLSR